MSYYGKQNGIPIYDYLDEVPDSIIESGQKFYLLQPPQEFIDEKGGTVIKGNSFTIFTFIGACILIVLVGTVTILTLQQLGYLFQGRPGQKVDDNLFEGGDGSVWVRDPETGEWKMAKGPRTDIIIWAIVAIGIIVVAILIWLTLRKRKGDRSEKEPDNPGRPPKKWWDQKYKEVKEGNPDYSDKKIRETVGNIWYHDLSESKKREILARE